MCSVLFFYWPAIYLSSFNAIIAVITVFFVRKKSFKQIGKLFIYVPVVALISTLSVSLLQYAHNGLNDTSITAKNALAFSSAASAPYLLSFCVTNLMFYILEKWFICIFVILLINLLPKKLLASLNEENLNQQIISQLTRQYVSENHKNMKNPLHKRIVFTFVISAVILVIMTEAIALRLYFDNTKKEKTQRAYSCVNLAADCIDPDRIEDYLKYGSDAPGYNETFIKLSNDVKVQKTRETIASHKYIEYGEVWFDAHCISTAARNMEIKNIVENSSTDGHYKITACRFEDHILLKMQSPEKSFEVIVALPSASKSAYIGITGENVHIQNIKVEQTNLLTSENDIPRIAEKLNYINRIESDILNVQIVKPLDVFTQGVEVKNGMKIYFHAQSLPDANLVWHCPYIILYGSEDGKVYGKNYREYAMIKFDGEENGSNENAENEFVMKKTESFTNWEDWEEHNKAGYECMVEFIKNGSEVMLRTHNKGIFIQNTTKVRNGNKEIFVAFSGDQVALTDIRIR